MLCCAALDMLLECDTGLGCLVVHRRPLDRTGIPAGGTRGARPAAPVDLARLRVPAKAGSYARVGARGVIVSKCSCARDVRRGVGLGARGGLPGAAVHGWSWTGTDVRDL